jgi:hypothetical protein
MKKNIIRLLVIAGVVLIASAIHIYATFQGGPGQQIAAASAGLQTSQTVETARLQLQQAHLKTEMDEAHNASSPVLKLDAQNERDLASKLLGAEAAARDAAASIASLPQMDTTGMATRCTGALLCWIAAGVLKFFSRAPRKPVLA